MLFSLSVGLSFALICTNNLLDYTSNFAFVSHVMQMDSTFPHNQLLSRSITSPTLHHALYWLIILGEGLGALLCLLGSAMLAKHLFSSSPAFADAKSLGTLGMSVLLLLFFFGFMTVGGEWFLMWQSQSWNGLNTAHRYFSVLGIFLIIHLLPEN
jgi:predicted small integral membrane protein